MLYLKVFYKNILNFLSDLRNNVDFLRPYELLERTLIKHNKRADLTSTLGLEAEDGINALLDQALNYEKLNITYLSLTTQNLDIVNYYKQFKPSRIVEVDTPGSKAEIPKRCAYMIWQLSPNMPHLNYN